MLVFQFHQLGLEIRETIILSLLCYYRSSQSSKSSKLLSKRGKTEFIINWETGVNTQKIEGLTTGLLDGIVTIKNSNTYLGESIVEMVGSNKGQLLKDSMKNPMSNVIGDMLRIACYRALGKPGMITYVHYDNSGNLNYSIIAFNKRVGKVLREAGAYLAVDINRPQVRRLYQESHEQVIKQFEKVFKIMPNLDPNADLLRYAVSEGDEIYIYDQFLKLISIILENED